MPYENTVDAVNKLVRLRQQFDAPSFMNIGPTQYYGFWVVVFISGFALNLASTIIEAVAPGILTSIGVPPLLLEGIICYLSYKLVQSTMLNYLPELTLLSTGHCLSVNEISALLDSFKQFYNVACQIGNHQLATPVLQNDFVQHLYETNDLKNIKSLTKLGLSQQILIERKLQTKRDEDREARSVGAKHSGSLTWLAAKSIIRKKVAINLDESSLTEDTLKIIEKARLWV